MKNSSYYLCGMALLSALLFSETAGRAASIHLSKPVSESIAVDGIYWKFDGGTPGESNPNPTADASGNGFDGILAQGKMGQGIPIYTEGKFGTAIRLEGGDPMEQDSHVVWDADEAPGLDDTKLDMAGKSLTAGAWIKFASFKDGEAQTLIVLERGISAGGHSFYNFSLVKRANTTWILRLSLPGGYIDAAQPIPPTTFIEEEWHHVGFSYEAEEGGGIVRFWLDDQLLGADIQTEFTVPEIAKPNDRLFTVGERSVSYHTSDFDGAIDEVFVTSGIHSFEK